MIIKNADWTELLTVAETIEHHLHNKEMWFGSGATADSLTPYQMVSGNGVYGTEVLILDTGDTPFDTGNVEFDFHRMLIIALSSSSTYYVQGVWGTGTFADALSAGQCAAIPVIKSIATGNAKGAPIDIMTKPMAVGTKVWVRVKNATNAATLDALFGIHEYAFITS